MTGFNGSGLGKELQKSYLSVIVNDATPHSALQSQQHRESRWPQSYVQAHSLVMKFAHLKAQ